ncbi:hypothetical protein Tco_1068992, partial [Tanacetum coccineum]
MAVLGAGNQVARRVMDDLIDFSGETSIQGYMKFFKAQQLRLRIRRSFRHLDGIGNDGSVDVHPQRGWRLSELFGEACWDLRKLSSQFGISSWRGSRVDGRSYLLSGAIDSSEANGIIRDPKLELESSRFTFDLVPLSYESVDVVVGENWLLRHKAEMVCHEKVVKMPWKLILMVRRWKRMSIIQRKLNLGQHEKKDVKGEIEIARTALIQQEIALITKEIELGLWSWDDLNSEGDAVEGVLGVGGDGSNSLKTVVAYLKVGSDNVVRGFKDVKSLSSKRISVSNIVSDNDDMVADSNNSKVGKVGVVDRMVSDPKNLFKVHRKESIDDVESCDVKKGKSLLSKRRRVYNVVSDDDDTVADDNKVYVADNVVNDKKKSIKRATKRKAIAGCDKVFSDVADAGNYVKPVDSTVKCDKVESGDVSYAAKKSKSLSSKGRRVLKGVSVDLTADDNK